MQQPQKHNTMRKLIIAFMATMGVLTLSAQGV